MSTIANIPFVYGYKLNTTIEISKLNKKESEYLLNVIAGTIKNGVIKKEEYESELIQNTVINRLDIISEISKVPKLYKDVFTIRNHKVCLIYSVNPYLHPKRVYIGKLDNKTRLILEPRKGFIRLDKFFGYTYTGDIISVRITSLNCFIPILKMSLPNLVGRLSDKFALCSGSLALYKAAVSEALVYNFDQIIHAVCCDNNKLKTSEDVFDVLYDGVLKVNPHLLYEVIDWGRIKHMIAAKQDKNKIFGNFSSKQSLDPLLSNSVGENKQIKTKKVKFTFSSIDKNIIKRLDKDLNRYMFGQESAVVELCQAVKRAAVGIRSPIRPIGSFIFAGQTGVGKTYCAKTLATVLGPEVGFVKINCSELALSHEVIKLIGAPPSYIGFDKGGVLTNAVFANPVSVVLFDEFEKAHIRAQEILLQILEDGELVDGRGEKVSFKDCIIILTTNLGSQDVLNTESSIGFGDKSCNDVKRKNIIEKCIEKRFSPEFINRIDKTIVFNSLTKKAYDNIIEFYLNELRDRVKINNNVSVIFKNSVNLFIYENSIDNKYGARPIRRFIEQEVSNLVADALLNNELSDIIVSVDNNKAIIKNLKEVFENGSEALQEMDFQ